MNSRQRRVFKRQKEREAVKHAAQYGAEMIPNPTLTKEEHPLRDLTDELDPDTRAIFAKPVIHRPESWWTRLKCHWLGIHCSKCLSLGRRLCCLCMEDLDV